MSVEFRVTSEFSELRRIAYERNNSPEWRSVFEIAPSVRRIVGLRGGAPKGKDIKDIYYDLCQFEQVNISYSDLTNRLEKFVTLEATYYSLAENFAARCALYSGLYERLDDFIDLGKELVSKTVWFRWRPDGGEDFISLHKRVTSSLKRYLLSEWQKSNWCSPFSSVEDYKLTKGMAISERDGKASPRKKPIFRLRGATRHLSLPTIIAVIDEGLMLEKIAPLSLIGYYPNGRGLGEVAKEIGVKRDTLSSALDRTTHRLIATKEDRLPRRSIKEIVEDLLRQKVMSYSSGKRVPWTDPRIGLLKLKKTPQGLSERDSLIISLARRQEEGVFKYSSEEIALMAGCSKVVVCRVIKRTVAC